MDISKYSEKEYFLKYLIKTCDAIGIRSLKTCNAIDIRSLKTCNAIDIRSLKTCNAIGIRSLKTCNAIGIGSLKTCNALGIGSLKTCEKKYEVNNVTNYFYGLTTNGIFVAEGTESNENYITDSYRDCAYVDNLVIIHIFNKNNFFESISEDTYFYNRHREYKMTVGEKMQPYITILCWKNIVPVFYMSAININGPHKTFHESGRIHTQGVVIKGKHHYTFNWFDEDGFLEKNIDYQNGKPHGACEIFHDECGYQLFYYKNGIKNGPQQLFWKNHFGEIIYEKSHCKNGFKDGLCETYINNVLVKTRYYIGGIELFD